MGNVDVRRPIKIERLNQRYYFASLIEQAYASFLLRDDDTAKIQMELLMILAEQADKWNKGQSSSIPMEKAQEMMNSIIFVIGIQLKSYKTPEQAVEMLKTSHLRLLFDQGLQLVQHKITICHRIQKRIMHHLFDTPNIYYRSTIVDGIHGFFTLYCPQFTADEIHITADYPICMGRPEFDGIEFIEAYLRSLEAENTFCICFQAQDVHQLLCSLALDYKNIPMNLFEPVLLSALALTMLHRNPEHLNLTSDDIHLLYQKLSNRSEEEIRISLRKALSSLQQTMKFPQKSKRYASMCIPQLANTIHHALKMKTLDKVFLVPKDSKQDLAFAFSYGDRMDDSKYRNIVEQILQMNRSEEKVNLIFQEIHSFADLLDILSDSELSESDFELFVHMLPFTVFAALLSQYPNDDFLERESEQKLFAALQKRKNSLSDEERKQVEDICIK